ncbi:MAG: outer membrane beta-barrel protein [Terriglobales bacterium]
MRRLTAAILLILALSLLAPAVFAQEERGEFGVFADFTRFNNLNNQNFWGAGGNLGFNLSKHVQLEGTMAYDFERNFVSGDSTTLGTIGSFQNTKFRILDGYFGPKFQTGIGPVKGFIAVKPGFMNFGITNQGVATGFVTSVSNVPSGDTHFSLFPSGGLEFFFHHNIGLRVEAGDTMYWQSRFTTSAGNTVSGGVNHNLTVRFGPQIRW